MLLLGERGLGRCYNVLIGEVRRCSIPQQVLNRHHAFLNRVIHLHQLSRLALRACTLSFFMLDAMVLQYCFHSHTYLQDSPPPPYSSKPFGHLSGNGGLVTFCDGSVPPYDPETPFRECGRESEVAAILRGDDLPLIQLLGRFRLFRDEELRGLLEAQFEHHLDLLIAYLRSPENGDGPADAPALKRDQKIEEILRQLKPSTSISGTTLDWSPRRAVEHTAADQIAADIHRESSRQFRQISFEDLMQQAQGYPVESVEDFVFSHKVLCVRLSTYLVLHPEESEKYTQVEKVS